MTSVGDQHDSCGLSIILFAGSVVSVLFASTTMVSVGLWNGGNSPWMAMIVGVFFTINI